MLNATREKSTFLHSSLQRWEEGPAARICLSDAITVQEQSSSDTALREFTTKGASYRHISGKRIVVSEGGFQMQNRVDKNKHWL